MVADYTRSSEGAIAKTEAKKPAHPRRLVQEKSTKTYQNSHQSIPLDLDCGLRRQASPAGKRKGMSRSATSVNILFCCYRLNLQAKKNLRKTQVGVNRVNQPKLIPPINTSGISTLAIHNASLLTDNRNSLRQSVTKGSDYHYSDMTGRVTITPRGMFCFTFAEDAHPLPLNARRFSATLVSV